jgi:hypothetical protein
MPPKKYELHDGRKGSALAIRVTPRASKNEIAEVLSDGTVKVRLMAAPGEGESETNQALLRFLADVLAIPASRLEIVAGATGRDKLVSILDLDANTVHKRILESLV